jgi:hypothetical protein
MLIEQDIYRFWTKAVINSSIFIVATPQDESDMANGSTSSSL